MTLDVAAAIADWRDPDSLPGPGGAEADFYTSRNPPGLPRNGPFQTIRELLMVRGVTPAVFNSQPSRPGWDAWLGVHAAAPNLTASGEERVNLKTADERALSNVRGFTPEIARAIIARRSQNEFNSLLDLLEVTPAAPANTTGLPTLPGRSPGQNPSGQRVISQDLLLDVADLLTVGDNDQAAGRININSAPAEVLACLDGIDLPLAQSLVAHRQSIGGFTHPIALLRAPGFDLDRLRPILPRITANTDTWRIRAEGLLPDRDTRARIEVVVRIESSSITTLSYREDAL
jgi:DNA uptake protein ComE-like DNA-binding protein